MHDISKKKLRLGLLLDSFEVPAWIYLMLKKIQNSDYAEINLIVLNGISNKKKIREGFIVKFSNFYLCNEAIKHLQDLKTLHKNTMKFSKTILKLDDKL